MSKMLNASERESLDEKKIYKYEMSDT